MADAVTTALSFFVAYLAWWWANQIFPGTPFGREIKVSSDLVWKIILFSIIWVIILTKLGAYTYQRFTSLVRETKLVAKASLFGTFVFFAMNFLLRFEYIPRTYVGIFFFVNLFALTLEKIIAFNVAKQIRKKGKDRKRVIVVGTGLKAKNFVETVERNLGWGLDVIGIVAEDRSSIGNTFCGKRVIGSNEDFEKVLHQNLVDEVIICASGTELAKVEEIFETCEREGVQVRLNSDFFGRVAKKVTVDQIYGLPIISFAAVQNSEWALYVKRLMDILLSGSLLIFLSPLFLLIALVVKATSEGPAFYEWNVMGFNKKPFRSWKFRTMVVDADARKEVLMSQNEMKGPVFKIKNDPRVTKVGRFLRKFSLDELPQLWSVFKGDMSLVGPRPAGPHELSRYESWHRRKLSIKPGITCLWQVSGRNKINDFNEWVRMDLEYIDNWSFWLDVKILFKTFLTVVKGTGY
ncbi:MAG: sugar transferase [Syntrophaceae bacterium]|nr:sugar transferase [Syntrophaceae bacterium]